MVHTRRLPRIGIIVPIALRTRRDHFGVNHLHDRIGTAAILMSSYRYTVEVRHGPTFLDGLAEELEELQLATGAPVTARSTWLLAWVGSYSPPEPWAVVVREAFTGRLDAAALLWERDRGDWDDLSPLGRRQQDRGWLPARSSEAATALGTAVAARLSSRRRPWRLRLGQLPEGDPVVAAIAGGIEGSRTVAGVPIPKVEFSEEQDVDAFLSSGLRKQLRKSHNRLRDDGLEVSIEFEADPDSIEVLLDEVEETHRAREHDVQRVSDLENEPGRNFWWSAILGHARRREAEIATLRIDGSLAAYVVSLLDHGIYRVFDGRFATAWSRFSPGRILERATLERALLDQRFEQLDWMNGIASEKLLAANAADPTEELFACSADLVLDLAGVGAPSAQAPTAEAGAVALPMASSVR